MARRYQHNVQELKALLLQSAEAIVVKKGLRGLNARLLAMDIGYTVGSIYMVFDSMADLVLHLNAKTLDNLLYILEQQHAQQQNPTAEGLVASYCEYAKENTHLWRALFEYRYYYQQNEPSWYLQTVEAAFRYFAKLLQAALPELVLTEDILMIKTFCASLHGILLSSPGQFGGLDGQKTQQACIDVLIRNLLQGNS